MPPNCDGSILGRDCYRWCTMWDSLSVDCTAVRAIGLKYIAMSVSGAPFGLGHMFRFLDTVGLYRYPSLMELYCIAQTGDLSY